MSQSCRLKPEEIKVQTRVENEQTGGADDDHDNTVPSKVNQLSQIQDDVLEASVDAFAVKDEIVELDGKIKTAQDKLDDERALIQDISENRGIETLVNNDDVSNTAEINKLEKELEDLEKDRVAKLDEWFEKSLTWYNKSRQYDE